MPLPRPLLTPRVQLPMLLLVAGLAGAPNAVPAAEGTLFIVGGGWRPNNAVVMNRLLAAAGGPKNCRAAIFRTAGATLEGATDFSARLQKFEVPAEQISIVDIHPGNAAQEAFNLAHVKTLEECNLVFFTGGDQTRITASLLDAKGADTPVLTAIRGVLKRGGVLAGSSAGAAMQSSTMISVGGLPDGVIDEGMDALDFGLSDSPLRRGLSVRPGLAFFEAGIIDQHFGQYRGRLGRLSRALIEHKKRYGFGIDENTALIVPPNGIIEVSGEGYVTIVDAAEAKLTDGPLGCEIKGLRISCLSSGDQFDPALGGFARLASKEPLKVGPDTFRGNFTIADIASDGAVRRALTSGLADNTSRQQIGVSLRYSQKFAHGYRFTFRKTERSRGFGGNVGDTYRYTVQDIALDIEPILASQESPRDELPVDLPEGAKGITCQALWYRGVLTADSERRLRPTDPITRGEFALAMTHALHLLPPLGPATLVADLTEESPYYDAVARVLEAKLLELDARQQFRPLETISRQEAAHALLQLYERNGGKPVILPAIMLKDVAGLPAPQQLAATAAVQAGLLAAPAGDFQPDKPLTRQATADALYRVLGFSW